MVTGCCLLCCDFRHVLLASGDWYCYEKLCVCTGAYPKVTSSSFAGLNSKLKCVNITVLLQEIVLLQVIAKDHPYVLGIRDTDTVKVKFNLLVT